MRSNAGATLASVRNIVAAGHVLTGAVLEGTVSKKGHGGGVKIDYRPVHAYTLTDDVDYIKPKARMY